MIKALTKQGCIAAFAAMLLGSPLQVFADEPSATTADQHSIYPIRKIGVTAAPDELSERVIVGNDTVPVVIPEHNFGRYDRGLFNYLFIPKGQWMAGMTANYADFSTDDVEVLGLLKNFNFSGELYSLKPYISYAFANNSTVGLRFNYTRGNATLGNMSVDMGDDLSFSIADVTYRSQSYGVSVFYRNYIGLGRSKRFGIFNEVDLAFDSGSSTFLRTLGGRPKETNTTKTSVNLNFSPGLTVFVMDYISFNISFGVFGVHLTNEKQLTDGADEGSRFTSGANFRFNIFNINFGLGVHI